jgi:hypothetical protein
VRQRDENNRLVWRTLCTASCDTTVYAGAEYRVSGDGVTGSRVIKIDPSPYPARLYAQAGSSGARTLGIVAVSVGGAALVHGLVGAVLSSSCTDCDAAARADNERRIWQLAVPLMLGGGAAVAGGLILMISNRTKLDFTSSDPTWAPRIGLGHGFELTPEGLRF